MAPVRYQNFAHVASPKAHPMEWAYPYKVSGGAGERGTRISTVTYVNKVGSSFGSGYDYHAFGPTFGGLAIGNEKIAMQHLNDRLASYLETVRKLEEVNGKLEIKIREAIEKRGPLEGKDYNKYNKIIAELRAKDIAELHVQITKVGVQVDVDAPKGKDLAKLMEEMRAKYEKITLKNQEELKAWHESKIKEVRVQVTESTQALKEATTVMTGSKRRYQEMEIEWQSACSLKASLEATLIDIEVRYKMEVEQSLPSLLRLQEELTEIRTNIQQTTREYESLLNIKVKLEAEFTEYRRLLDGGAALKLEHALDQQRVQSKVKITQTLVDGKVMSERY